MTKSALVDLVPPVLAVANIHPDHLDVCVEHCCTGSRLPCRLPRGTITLVRRTAGGSTRKEYGVIGIWSFTGQTSPVSRRESLWPARWDTKIVFEPLVRRFEHTWCEDFSVPPTRGIDVHKTSVHVPGLAFTSLQGGIVTIKDLRMAQDYLAAILKDRADEISVDELYMGRREKVSKILEALKARLDAVAGGHGTRTPKR